MVPIENRKQTTQQIDINEFLHFSSSYNDEELNTVMNYIQQLLQTTTTLTQLDIGVVSPYKLQCDKISSACKRMGFENIQIGTSETFQGQEKKVIIVSAVAARRRNPGDFLGNPQVSYFVISIHIVNIDSM